MSDQINNLSYKFHISSSDLKHLLIEPTGFCNAKCPHCPRYTDDGFLHSYIPETHLTIDALLTGLRPDKLKSLQQVEFAGATGDPMMNPCIEELIDFFNFVPLVTVDTNGGLRNKQWWTELARFSNLQVVWSIDGLQDTNHLYRIGVDYKKVIENSAAFISAGGNAVWKCIIFKHNEHQIDEIKQQAKSLGFSKVEFIRAYDYRFQNLKSWPVVVEGKYSHDIQPGSLSQFELNFKNAVFTKSTPRPRPAKTGSDLLCPWAKQKMAYINVLGHLLPCCMMTHETTNDYIGKTIFYEMVGKNFDNISLYHNDMDHIFETYYSKNFTDRLKNKQTRHPLCNRTCGNILEGSGSAFKGHRESVLKFIKNKE